MNDEIGAQGVREVLGVSEPELNELFALNFPKGVTRFGRRGRGMTTSQVVWSKAQVLEWRSRVIVLVGLLQR